MTDHDEFDDELLSAYVDGELTASERALVEERLRTDPHAAQLVDELRALSSAIKSLPRETLGRDLRASVQAEVDGARADSNADSNHRHIVPLSEPLDPPRGFRRGFIWSTIAIAAALMLMFVEAQKDQTEFEVADGRKVDRPNRAVGRDRDAAPRTGEALPAMGQMRALDEITNGEATDAAKPAAGVGGGTIAAPTGAPAPDTHSFADLAEKDKSALAGNRDETAQSERLLKLDEATSQPQGALTEQLAMSREALAPSQATESAAESRLSAAGAAPAASAPSAPAPAAVESEAASAVTTVELEVRGPDGVAQFDRLLADNNFHVQPTTEDAEAATNTWELASEPGRPGPGVPSEDRKAKDLALADNDSGVEVLVEGSPAQVQELLFRCAEDPKTFTQVKAPKSISGLNLFARQSKLEDESLSAEAATPAEGNALANAPADDFGTPREESKELSESAGAAATGGGFGGQSDRAREFSGGGQAQGRSQVVEDQAVEDQLNTDGVAEANKQKSPPGRAWYLPSGRWGGFAYGYGLEDPAVSEDKKTEAPVAQSGVELGATLGTTIDAPPQTPSTRSFADSDANNQYMRRGVAQLETTPSGPPQSGQIRVLFVLRTPSPSSAEPAAQPSSEAGVPPNE
jgi:hypothetical protein